MKPLSKIFWLVASMVLVFSIFSFGENSTDPTDTVLTQTQTPNNSDEVINAINNGIESGVLPLVFKAIGFTSPAAGAVTLGIMLLIRWIEKKYIKKKLSDILEDELMKPDNNFDQQHVNVFQRIIDRIKGKKKKHD